MEKKTTKGAASTRQKVRERRRLAKEQAFGPAPVPAGLTEGQDRSPGGRGPGQERGSELERLLAKGMSEALGRVHLEASAAGREAPSVAAFVVGLILYQPGRPAAADARAWAVKTAITSPSPNQADRQLAAAVLEALATGETLKSPYAAIYEQLALHINAADGPLAPAPPKYGCAIRSTSAASGTAGRWWSEAGGWSVEEVDARRFADEAEARAYAERQGIGPLEVLPIGVARPGGPRLGTCDLCKEDAIYAGSDGEGEKKVSFRGCWDHYEQAEADAKKKRVAP